ncbi:hypothetical protein J3Q64DRAFT_1699724 [Phycomyces blakesleeanus]|uniref:Uncharacterized protein n=1 Tax=Phycomyces blakesleeanus TaxID=4837 RepID=A0ABR3AXK7_PHYBL
MIIYKGSLRQSNTQGMQFTPSVLRNPQFFSYKNRYNSLFPVFPPLPPGFLSVVLGFRHVSSVQFRFAFKHKYFLNPTQLSASVQCPVPSCFLAQVLFKPSAAVY